MRTQKTQGRNHIQDISRIGPLQTRGTRWCRCMYYMTAVAVTVDRANEGNKVIESREMIPSLFH